MQPQPAPAKQPAVAPPKPPPVRSPLEQSLIQRCSVISPLHDGDVIVEVNGRKCLWPQDGNLASVEVNHALRGSEFAYDFSYPVIKKTGDQSDYGVVVQRYRKLAWHERPADYFADWPALFPNQALRQPNIIIVTEDPEFKRHEAMWRDDGHVYGRAPIDGRGIAFIFQHRVEKSTAELLGTFQPDTFNPPLTSAQRELGILSNEIRDQVSNLCREKNLRAVDCMAAHAEAHEATHLKNPDHVPAALIVYSLSLPPYSALPGIGSAVNQFEETTAQLGAMREMLKNPDPAGRRLWGLMTLLVGIKGDWVNNPPHPALWMNNMERLDAVIMALAAFRHPDGQIDFDWAKAEKLLNDVVPVWRNYGENFYRKNILPNVAAADGVSVATLEADLAKISDAASGLQYWRNKVLTVKGEPYAEIWREAYSDCDDIQILALPVIGLNPLSAEDFRQQIAQRLRR